MSDTPVVADHLPAMARTGQRIASLDVFCGIAVLGIFLINTTADWAGSSAIPGMAISRFGTVPMALGDLSLIVLWAARLSGGVHVRLQAVGQMALTNYLMQTIIGVAFLTIVLDGVDMSQTFVLGFAVVVWVLLLTWSPWWLARFHFGPFEWAWRSATYWSPQALRRWRQPLRLRLRLLRMTLPNTTVSPPTTASKMSP